MGKAMVIINQLDIFASKKPSHFVDLRNAVIDEFKNKYKVDIPKSRIFFVSLKPHLLNPSSGISSQDFNEPGFDFRKEHRLVQQAREFDGKYMPKFLENIFPLGDEKRYELNFGLCTVIDAFHNIGKAYVEKNYNAICKEIKSDGASLLQQVKEATRQCSNYDQVMRELDLLIDLICEGLKAMSNVQNHLFVGALENAKKQCGLVSTPRHMVNLVDSVRMTLDEDLREAEASIGPISFATPEIIESIDKASELFRTLESPYCGNTSIARVSNWIANHRLFYVLRATYNMCNTRVFWVC